MLLPFSFINKKETLEQRQHIPQLLCLGVLSDRDRCLTLTQPRALYS